MIYPDNYLYMPTLETERLRLRKLTMRDAEDIFRYSRDPEVARHVLWDAHRSISKKAPSVELTPVLQSLPPGDLLYFWAPQAEETTGQAAVCLQSVALGRPSRAAPTPRRSSGPRPIMPPWLS